MSQTIERVRFARAVQLPNGRTAIEAMASKELPIRLAAPEAGVMLAERVFVPWANITEVRLVEPEQAQERRAGAIEANAAAPKPRKGKG